MGCGGSGVGVGGGSGGEKEDRICRKQCSAGRHVWHCLSALFPRHGLRQEKGEGHRHRCLHCLRQVRRGQHWPAAPCLTAWVMLFMPCCLFLPICLACLSPPPSSLSPGSDCRHRKMCQNGRKASKAQRGRRAKSLLEITPSTD